MQASFTATIWAGTTYLTAKNAATYLSSSQMMAQFAGANAALGTSVSAPSASQGFAMQQPGSRIGPSSRGQGSSSDDDKPWYRLEGPAAIIFACIVIVAVFGLAAYGGGPDDFARDFACCCCCACCYQEISACVRAWSQPNSAQMEMAGQLEKELEKGGEVTDQQPAPGVLAEGSV